MNAFQLEDIYRYHDAVIKSTGGEDGVRDRGLVESAYNSAFQGFGDEEIELPTGFSHGSFSHSI